MVIWLRHYQASSTCGAHAAVHADIAGDKIPQKTCQEWQHVPGTVNAAGSKGWTLSKLKNKRSNRKVEAKELDSLAERLVGMRIPPE